MEEDKPIWTEEEQEKVKAWLKSPEGIAKISEITKGESEIDRMARRSKEIRWWHKIKDIPFNI